MRHIKRIRLSAFLDGEVSEEERAKISRHLKVCSQCRREAEQLSQVSGFFTSVQDVEVSPYFLTRVRRRISEKESRFRFRLPFLEWIRKLRFERIAVPVGTTALLFLFLLLGSHLGTVIYQKRVEEALMQDVGIAEVFGTTSLDDFPEGSLGAAYLSMFAQGGE